MIYLRSCHAWQLPSSSGHTTPKHCLRQRGLQGVPINNFIIHRDDTFPGARIACAACPLPLICPTAGASMLAVRTPSSMQWVQLPLPQLCASCSRPPTSCGNLDALREGADPLFHLWPEVPDEALQHRANISRAAYHAKPLNDSRIHRSLHGAQVRALSADAHRCDRKDAALSQACIGPYLNRPCSGVPKSADGVALNLLGHLPEHVNFLHPRISLLHAGHDVIQPWSTLPVSGK